MKYIFLFIGLGLLLSGCEATDPDIYKCVGKEYRYFDDEGNPSSPTKLPKSHPHNFMVIDEKRKTISRLTEGGRPINPKATETLYTEEGNFIKTEEMIEPYWMYENGLFREIRLDKISGTLSITRYDGITNGDPKKSFYTYLCESTEPVIR